MFKLSRNLFDHFPSNIGQSIAAAVMKISQLGVDTCCSDSLTANKLIKWQFVEAAYNSTGKLAKEHGVRGISHFESPK
jgi:hypothetical protein